MSKKQNWGTITLSNPKIWWYVLYYTDQSTNGFDRIVLINDLPTNKLLGKLYSSTDKKLGQNRKPQQTYCMCRWFQNAFYTDGKNQISCLDVPKDFCEPGITHLYFGNRVPTMEDFIPNTVLTDFEEKLQLSLDQEFNLNRETGELFFPDAPNYVSVKTPVVCAKAGLEYNINGSGIHVNIDTSVDELKALINNPKMVLPATPELVKAIFTRQY